MDEHGQIVARGRGGPSNPMRVGFGGALASICDAARAALQNAKIASDELVSLCAGLAGAAHPDAERKMKRLLEEEFPHKIVRVCTDLDLTLEGMGEGAAIVLIAGTGSAAVGRDAKGHMARVGGHGPLLGDEGSAYYVGQRAAISALRFFERTGNETPLGKRILSQTGEPGWTEFQSHVYSAPDDVFPKLFPVVVEAAETGDADARTLIEDCVTALAGLVRDLSERLQLQSQKFLLAKTGGMVGRSGYFDRCLDEQVRKAVPYAQLGALQLNPAEAAAHLALRLLPVR